MNADDADADEQPVEETQRVFIGKVRSTTFGFSISIQVNGAFIFLQIPIMLRSAYCMLAGCTAKDLTEFGECEFDEVTFQCEKIRRKTNTSVFSYLLMANILQQKGRLLHY